MKVHVYLLTLLSLALQSYATTPLFATCAGIGSLQSGLLNGLLSSVGGILVNLVSSTLLGGECISTCTSGGYKYAVFAQGIDLLTNPGTPGLLGNLLGSCYCSNSQLPASNILEGADPNGACSTTIANLIGARVTYLKPNAIDFKGCVGTKPTGAGSASTVNGVEACATKCGSNNFAIQATGTQMCGLIGGALGLLTGSRTLSYQCSCLSSAPPATGYSTNCNQMLDPDNPCRLLVESHTYAWNVYGVTNNPSGITRRRALPADRPQEEMFCPSPLQPCRIAGTDGFECVNTATELDSCGGCVAGDYIRNVTSGTDCSSIPGVALGGVSCVSGHCQVDRCLPGWTKYKGRCLRKVNLSNARRVVQDV